MDKPLEDLTPDEVISLIRAAHLDIAEAYSVFNMMVEQELVDYAIHKMGAAENRYRYLLRWAKEKKISLFNPDETWEVK